MSARAAFASSSARVALERCRGAVPSSSGVLSLPHRPALSPPTGTISASSALLSSHLPSLGTGPPSPFTEARLAPPRPQPARCPPSSDTQPTSHGHATHHDVQAAKLGDGRLDHSGDLSLLGHVGLDGKRLRGGEVLEDELGGLLDGLLVDVGEDDARALGGELERGLEADAAGRQWRGGATYEAAPVTMATLFWRRRRAAMLLLSEGRV
jgi:hypothetical protein